MEFKYPQVFKEDLFNKVVNRPNTLPTLNTENGDNSILLFLMEILDLHSMPSGDKRFENAYQDVDKHLIKYQDWGYRWIFKKRFKIVYNDELFTKFLEALVNPKFRSGREDMEAVVYFLNSELASLSFNLINIVSVEGNTNYSLKSIVKEDYLTSLKNDIPFFYNKTPDQFPCFELIHDNWDDFGRKSSFTLFYLYESKRIDLKWLKITNGKDFNTGVILPNFFYELDEDFCSIGTDEEYYLSLQSNFKDKLENILYALKDAAYFPHISDRFRENQSFNVSLLRGDETEQLSRNIRFILEGKDIRDKYKFLYKFQPNYSDEEVDLYLEYSNENIELNRIYAIIGENGTGKTQLITKLPLDLFNPYKDYLFNPSKPKFSKIISVSFSVFDDFMKPINNTEFDYVLIGIHDVISNADNEIKNSFVNLYNNHIVKHDRQERWYNIISKFIEESLLREFINDNWLDSYDLNEDEYLNTVKKLSSGQRILFEILTNIIANIRFDSLILFDEPETHLHPNAISQLVTAIYELTEDFDSYCLMTTHSPIIIQNMFAKNVYVMKKDGNYPSLRKIGRECFGENLTVLTEDVFGNSDIEKQYKRILDNMINKFYSYDEILEKLEVNGLPLSLNAKLYLKSQINEEN